MSLITTNDEKYKYLTNFIENLGDLFNKLILEKIERTPEVEQFRYINNVNSDSDTDYIWVICIFRVNLSVIIASSIENA